MWEKDVLSHDGSRDTLFPAANKSIRKHKRGFDQTDLLDK